MTMNPIRGTFSVLATIVAATALTGGDKAAGQTANAQWPDIIEAKKIAEEGFIYGLPLVMNYAVMNEFAVDTKSSQFKAPFNQLNSMHRVATYEDTAVVTPNSDTPYTTLWLDLRAEPMVVSVPAVAKERYYSVQLTDGNTYNFGYIGSRATGSEPGDYLVTGPDWKGGTPPAGIKKVFSSTTPFAFAIFRTQLFNPEDMPNVEKVQAGYKGQPLSAYLKQPAPPAAPKIAFVPATTEGIKKNFYEYLDAALEFVPPSAEDKEIRAKLARIGVGPGKTFNFKELPLGHKLEIGLGMKDGDDKVDKFLASGVKNINGWSIGSFFGDRAFYNGDWLMRAGASKGGIYGNDAVEAMYPMTRTDETGETLDGSKHKYTLTFPAGQLPPVNSFWSVTMYDGKSQLLIKNPINRYLINSPMLRNMKKNEDGSLTLYIQKDSPGADNEANWLPAPNDTIYLVMRLYWPKTEAPSILPAGEGTWKPPGLVKASGQAATGVGAGESGAALSQPETSPQQHVPLQKTIGQGKAEVVPSLIVVNANGVALQGQKLTLIGVAPNSIVFADRPVRAAGHDLTAHVIEEWATGDDSFAHDPPNATVSGFSKDGGTVRDAVVVLKSPKLEGDKLTFDVDVLEGDLTGADGAAAVFIDIIGRPFTPRSFAGAARRGYRGAWYAGAVAAPYYGVRCGYYPYPPCR